MTWNFGPEVDRAIREAERGMRGFRFDVPRRTSTSASTIAIATIASRAVSNIACRTG